MEWHGIYSLERQLLELRPLPRFLFWTILTLIFWIEDAQNGSMQEESICESERAIAAHYQLYMLFLVVLKFDLDLLFNLQVQLLFQELVHRL